jgi:hypothetical protein
VHYVRWFQELHGKLEGGKLESDCIPWGMPVRPQLETVGARQFFPLSDHPYTSWYFVGYDLYDYRNIMLVCLFVCLFLFLVR